MTISHILFSNVATEFAKLGLGPITFSLQFPDNPSNESYYICVGDLKLGVSCNTYGNKGRGVVRYSRPFPAKGGYVEVYDEKNSRVADPSISVSLGRTAEEIAKDIARRLLPDAKTVDALVKARNEKTDNFETGKLELIEKVAGYLNAKPERSYQANVITGKIDPYVGVKSFGAAGYGHFTVSGPDSISLELHSMGKEFGLEVVRAIRKVIYERAYAEALRN